MRTFSLFIHHKGSSTPGLQVEATDGMEPLIRIAREVLYESDSRGRVEVREEDRLVFILARDGLVWPEDAQAVARP